ncbi:MAG: type II toxin-antitoxin system PemK/MazF family toxin [Elusimicrobia bacterium]|nr:type II toxin-antitoxin system PemK/MazF family toxin [Elusimicrobiota bacterium]
MQRGEIWWAHLPKPVGKRPVLLLSRTKAIQVRLYVTVALITRTIRNIPVEVSLGLEDGLPKPCVINMDNINTIPKALLTQRAALLSPHKMHLAEKALKFALGID